MLVVNISIVHGFLGSGGSDAGDSFQSRHPHSCGLGANGVVDGWRYGKAVVGKFMGIFLLVFTVLQTAVNSDFDCSSILCLAIGLAVFPSHTLRFPIDGSSSKSQSSEQSSSLFWSPMVLSTDGLAERLSWVISR